MQAHNPHLSAILKEDKWQLVELTKPDAPALFRYRVPVPSLQEVKGYGKVLRVLWAYADADTGAMPSSEDSESMERFETLLSEALEEDHHAYLAAVLTFDGARQWVFYSDDISECGRRINRMPQGKERYPIEMDSFDDPAWTYLRETLLPKFQ